MSRTISNHTTKDSYYGFLEEIAWCLEVGNDITRSSASDLAVSKWNVCEHLEHLMLADHKIVKWIEDVALASDCKHRSEKPKEVGTLILASGQIPRGRGPAPEGTIPKGESLARVISRLKDVRTLVGGLAGQLDAVSACLNTLPHHVLGHFTPSEWLRFLHIHHIHHANIINDIVRKPA